MMLIISIVGADYALNHLMSNDVHLPQIAEFYALYAF